MIILCFSPESIECAKAEGDKVPRLTDLPQKGKAAAALDVKNLAHTVAVMVLMVRHCPRSIFPATAPKYFEVLLRDRPLNLSTAVAAAV